jgi:hypothetical protein
MNRIAARFIHYGGKVTLNQLPAKYQDSVKAVSDAMEKKVRGDDTVPGPFLANPYMQYPKVTEAKIQYALPSPQSPEPLSDSTCNRRGSKPHKSAKDPSDPKEVVTVSYHTASGTRVTSVHAHEDSTYKEFPSRNANKGK